jgi:hypothetical protein
LRLARFDLIGQLGEGPVVKKELRRLRRFWRRAPEQRQAAPPSPIHVPPVEGAAILWVQPTGVKRYHRGFHCRDKACGHYTKVNMPADQIAEYERICGDDHEWPEPRPTITCKCGAVVEMNSAGLDTEYQAPSTGEVFERLRELPPGAVWAQQPWQERGLHNWISHRDAEGNPFPKPKKGRGQSIRFLDRPHPDDGRVLVCRLPDGHDWVIDSRCNNCPLPLDDEHWCWNRSGRPEDGTLDVRKGKPGQTTCSAGAGSIRTGRWHGFLHSGALKTC